MRGKGIGCGGKPYARDGRVAFAPRQPCPRSLLSKTYPPGLRQSIETPIARGYVFVDSLDAVDSIDPIAPPRRGFKPGIRTSVLDMPGRRLP